MELKKTWEKLKQNKNLPVILIIGVVLLIAGSVFFPSKSQPKEPEKKAQASQINVKELEKILSRIEGAGKVNVFLTYEDYGKKQLASDVKKDVTEGQNPKEETDITVKTMNRQGAGQEPYVVSERTPEVKGVLVIATGARDEQVKMRIYESVKGAIGVPLNKIHVEAAVK